MSSGDASRLHLDEWASRVLGDCFEHVVASPKIAAGAHHLPERQRTMRATFVPWRRYRPLDRADGETAGRIIWAIWLYW